MNHIAIPRSDICPGCIGTGISKKDCFDIFIDLVAIVMEIKFCYAFVVIVIISVLKGVDRAVVVGYMFIERFVLLVSDIIYRRIVQYTIRIIVQAVDTAYKPGRI